jgi:hypothetical protein
MNQSTKVRLVDKKRVANLVALFVGIFLNFNFKDWGKVSRKLHAEINKFMIMMFKFLALLLKELVVQCPEDKVLYSNLYT